MKAVEIEEILLDSYDYCKVIFKFEIRKCGQILCAHKPCFLMMGHISLEKYPHQLSIFS